MPLSLMKTGISAAVGGIDILADYYNPTTSPSGSFTGILDWERVGLAIAGTAMAAIGGRRNSGKGSMISNIGEAIELSSIPLAEKSIANYFLAKTTNTFRANPAARRGNIVRPFGRGQITVRRPGISGSAPGGIPGVIY